MRTIIKNEFGYTISEIEYDGHCVTGGVITLDKGRFSCIGVMYAKDAVTNEIYREVYIKYY